MPKIQKVFTLEVTPEQFVRNCSEVELQEVILLANRELDRIERESSMTVPFDKCKAVEEYALKRNLIKTINEMPF